MRVHVGALNPMDWALSSREQMATAFGVRLPSGTTALYTAILGVLLSGAAYVPVDNDEPDERALSVFREASVCAVLGPTLRPALTGIAPLGRRCRPHPEDDAWVIFTSGSTGRPKGVAVSHRSAAAFVDAEAQLFSDDAPGPGDRVLGALSVAFDASCEEMWLAWRHGACLVPAPRALVQAGLELGPWLTDRRVSVVSTVPTLAALWPVEALRTVRLLILGGETCPPELVSRLASPGRRIWNTYGPTEATVVSCAALLTEEQPVRIGRPLAGWQLAVIGPDDRPVSAHEVGELVIGGVGLARYLDAAKGANRFTPLHTLGWDRVYRTGDLVRANPAGLEFVGRTDDQVKIGGRRIELGEIDAALLSLPGVAAAAAAVRNSDTSVPVLVGYVVPAQPDAVDPASARATLARVLPPALLPLVAILDHLPTRTCGKIDRDALPWPLPTVGGGSIAVLPSELRWLAGQWHNHLGPVPLTADSDFFSVGGASLAAAHLVSDLRRRYPTVSVSDVYSHPTLTGLAARLEQFNDEHARRKSPAMTAERPASHPAAWRNAVMQNAVMQGAILLGLLTLVGLRWMTVGATLMKLLGNQAVANTVPWVPLVLGLALLVSLPGRLATAVVGARLLTGGIEPGRYRRGGGVHLRLWTAERLVTVCRVGTILGTPWAARYARALGCQVGENVSLYAAPPVTGLAVIGNGACIESEVDLAGWWLDSDTLHIGAVRVGAAARVGTRCTLMPGAAVGAGAEVEPGCAVAGPIPPEQRWEGSPARYAGSAAVGWPAVRTPIGSPWQSAYPVTLVGLGLLPLLAAVPAFTCLKFLGDAATFSAVVTLLLVAGGIAVLVTFVVYALLIAGVVRAAGRALQPGMYPIEGKVAFCAWLVERLLVDTRRILFPLYASVLTPAWLRLLGARVGRRVEASTVVPLPNLLTLGDGGFLADQTLVAPARRRGGWLHLGPVEIGARSFVGNSSVVGPDRRVADGALIGVLSGAPPTAIADSSWLGQAPIRLPRSPEPVDPKRTFDPPRRLVAARSAVELCRAFAIVASYQLAVLAVAALYLAQQRFGLAVTAAIGGLVMLCAGAIAGAVTSAIKWMLMGRCRAARHPLWSTHVWRSELVDTFVEVLAVPWLAEPALGSPLLNVWLRSMGATVGAGVWCESWWLPEPDLVTLGDRVSVNRGVVVQTHLFHDRVLRLGTVHFDAGASIGPHSIVLPDTAIGAGTSMAAASLAMQGESLPAHSQWEGNPLVAATRLHDRRLTTVDEIPG